MQLSRTCTTTTAFLVSIALCMTLPCTALPTVQLTNSGNKLRVDCDTSSRNILVQAKNLANLFPVYASSGSNYINAATFNNRATGQATFVLNDQKACCVPENTFFPTGENLYYAKYDQGILPTDSQTMYLEAYCPGTHIMRTFQIQEKTCDGCAWTTKVYDTSADLRYQLHARRTRSDGTFEGIAVKVWNQNSASKHNDEIRLRVRCSREGGTDAVRTACGLPTSLSAVDPSIELQGQGGDNNDDADDDDDDKISRESLIGGLIAIVMVVLLTMGVVICLCRKRNHRPEEQEEGEAALATKNDNGANDESAVMNVDNEDSNGTMEDISKDSASNGSALKEGQDSIENV